MTRPAVPGVTANPWQALRRLTGARIALGRAGTSIPTHANLDLQQAHAQARDAVHLPFDAGTVAGPLQALGWPTLALRSRAVDRHTYLHRPDLGRRLDSASRAQLDALGPHGAPGGLPTLAFVVADGLSALAVHRHAAALLSAVRMRLPASAWRIAPVALVQHGRVAIGDEIGEALGADLVAVLIGERPGLSSPDSLGVYLTWSPRIGLTDAARNCISNIRPEGLGIEAAAGKLLQLAGRALQLRLTGVDLKDDADPPAGALGGAAGAGFLLDDVAG